MTVSQVPGETTRFYVESTSLECQDCHKLYTRQDMRNKELTDCTRCGGPLGIRFHLVDISCWDPIGECSCEHFQYRLKKEVEKISPIKLRQLSQSEAHRLRCTHIEAARTYAIDLSIRQHQREQNQNIKGYAEV